MSCSTITYCRDARRPKTFGDVVFLIKRMNLLSSLLLCPHSSSALLHFSAYLFALKLLFRFSSSSPSTISPPLSLSWLYCPQPALTGDDYSRSYCTTTCKAFTTSSIPRLRGCKRHGHKTHSEPLKWRNSAVNGTKDNKRL